MTGELDMVRRSFAAQSQEARDLTPGFVAGYNRYLRDNAERLPEPCKGKAWVRPLSVEDALLLMQGSLMAPTFLRQIAAAAPPGTASASLSAPGVPRHDPEMALGSNGWAFGADATLNKRGLLVGNLTRAFSAKKWHRLPFTRDEVRRTALGPGLRLRD